MTTATLLRPGDMLGGFRVDDVIGIGGMAIVYRAEQISLGRSVALKVLSSKLTSDTVFRERFRREGTHAATLEHPNIVPVYDSGEQEGHLYLAMRLVEGTNLAELILTSGLTTHETINLLRPIASALDTAHATGLIHRDVKPQNILIAANGHPYLADFGVAKGSNTDGLTATGGFVGSVNYASPEQIRGLTLTPASDIYALTAVLYQCLTGQVPYPRETDAGIMHAHLTEPPPTLPSLAGADSDFHTVLARGMAKDSGARYGHAGDLINAAALSVERLPSEMHHTTPAFPPTASDEPPSPPRSAQTPACETEAVAREDLVELRDAGAMTAEDRRRAPAEPAPPPSRPSRRWPVVAAGMVLAIAATVALLLTLSSGGSRRSFVVRSGHLMLNVPRGWHRDAPTLADLALRSPILLSRDGVEVNAGTITDPATLAAAPPAMTIAARGEPAQSQLEHLALGLAKSYSWQGGKSGPLSLYVISTTAGELALACGSRAAAALDRVIAACSQLIRGARVSGSRIEYPGADPAVGSELTTLLRPRQQLASARGLQASRLPSRAPALSRIARADADATAGLRRARIPTRYRALVSSLADSLMREGAAARELARAASAADRSLYKSRRTRLRAEGDSVERAGRALTRRGFALAHIDDVRAASLPPRPPSNAAASPGRRPAADSRSAGSTPTEQAPVRPTSAPHYNPPSRSAPKPRSKAPQTVVSAPS